MNNSRINNASGDLKKLWESVKKYEKKLYKIRLYNATFSFWLKLIGSNYLL